MDRAGIMKLHKRIYYAGLFDGEGCVYIAVRRAGHRCSPEFALTVNLANTYRPVLYQLKKEYAHGSVRAQAKGSNIWCWAASGPTALRFLKDVVDFLIVKRVQAKLAIKFRERIQTNNVVLTAREVKIREGYAKKLRELKRAYRQ
jgi:hypothetical protein